MLHHCVDTVDGVLLPAVRVAGTGKGCDGLMGELPLHPEGAAGVDELLQLGRHHPVAGRTAEDVPVCPDEVIWGDLGDILRRLKVRLPRRVGGDGFRGGRVRVPFAPLPRPLPTWRLPRTPSPPGSCDRSSPIRRLV